MQVSLTGKIAVVTGGSVGLGRASVRGLTAAGATVISFDVREPEWSDLELPDDAQQPAAYTGDVRDGAARVEFFDRIRTEYGRLDIAVNNAGTLQRYGNVLEVEEDEVRRVFDTNVFALYSCCREEVSLMTEGGGGVILNVASQAGKLPWPGFAAYGMSKAAVIGLTQALAIEAAPAGIRVNAVCPGVMDTEQTSAGYAQLEAATGVSASELRRAKLRDIPMGRFGNEDDMASMVAWLASDLAAFTTGSSLNLTGGEQVTF